jgi:hypothetical protein
MRSRRFATLEVCVVVALALATMLFILIAIGTESWPVLLGWTIGWAVVGGAMVAHRPYPVLRLVFALALIPLFVLLVFEGGFLMLPALMALVVFEASRNIARRQRDRARGAATP